MHTHKYIQIWELVVDTITSALVSTQHHQQPPPAPTIDALKDDVLLKTNIAPTIAENITLMCLSYPHFSRLDTLTDVSKKAIKFCYRF